MGLFDNFKKTDVRSLENPAAPVSADDFLRIMRWGDFSSAAGVTVNFDNALGVPVVCRELHFRHFGITAVGVSSSHRYRP